MCVCAGLRHHGAVGVGVVGVAFVAVLAEPPPSKGAPLLKNAV